MAASLLDVVRGLLERTYAMRSGLDDLGPYLIGDEGYRRLYGGGAEDTRSVGAATAVEARTLVRETDRGVRATVYFPDAMIRRLERFPPQRGLGDENVQPFAVLIEELDHLLFIAERTRDERPVTLLELELHANVSKHLVLARFLAGRRKRLGAAHRLWLQQQLFDRVRYCDDDPVVRARYRQAAREAVRFLAALRPLPPAARVATLRHFHGADSAGKLALIHDLVSA